MRRLGEDTGGVGIDELEFVVGVELDVGLCWELVGTAGGVNVLLEGDLDGWVDDVVGQEEIGFLCVTAGKEHISKWYAR